jgi:orotate phosphoribosyltransferase
MKKYQKDFAVFLIKEKALKFGRFELKSGRISPYFFNSSSFNSGNSVDQLGQYYAESIQYHLPLCTSVFGPAYKGIPLCLSTAIAMSRSQEKDIGYFFNRKEKKGHGDKGLLVGKIPLEADVIALVDDVITDGQTKIEVIQSLKELFKLQIQAVFVAFDRMEKNDDGIQASQAFSEKTGIPVHAIITIYDVLSLLKEESFKDTDQVPESSVEEIESYLKNYSNLNSA